MNENPTSVESAVRLAVDIVCKDPRASLDHAPTRDRLVRLASTAVAVALSNQEQQRRRRAGR